MKQPLSAWTRSLRTDTPSHFQRLKRLSRTKRGDTDCSTTARKVHENGRCPWKPWRTLVYSARTSHCLAWNLDNHRTSTGTRHRRNHRESSLVTCVATRLNERPTTRQRRVLRLHKRMIQAPEDVMCYAVQGTIPLWKNTNATVRDTRAVFKHSLAKKRKEGMAQRKPRKK